MKNTLIKIAYAALFAVLLLSFGSNLCKSQGNCIGGSESDIQYYCGDGSSDLYKATLIYSGNNLELNQLRYYRTTPPNSYKYEGDSVSAIKFGVAYSLTQSNPITHTAGCYDITLNVTNCWQTDYWYNGSIWETDLEPCSNNCCEYTYRVCYNKLGQAYSAKLTGSTTGTLTCPGVPCSISICGNSQFFPDTVTFTYSNDSMTVNNVAVPPRIGSIAEGQIQGDAAISLYPNPSDGKINISFTSQDKGNLTFKIFNTLGICVESLNYEKSMSEFNSELDLTNFNTGVYYITVFINNEPVRETSFIINK